MLKTLQIMFPEVFEQYPELFSKLNSKQHDRLSALFTLIEKHESTLINKRTVRRILKNAINNLPELEYLIHLLLKYNCLNRYTLRWLFRNHEIAQLKESVERLSRFMPLSAETITFLLSMHHAADCVAFINRATKTGIDFDSIDHFLSEQRSLNSLGRAVTLFDHCKKLGYGKEHFQQFSILMKILDNPLCRTIFDARLRCFSDYSSPSDSLKSQDIDDLITKLCVLDTEEDRVSLFFDFFAKMRPFPDSQKYLTKLNVAAQVTRALNSYCTSEIETVDSQEDYLNTVYRIKALRAKGGDAEHFEAIKYDIACWIETEDLCSTRNYKQLMDEISKALSKPQVNLDSFDKKLENTTGYREYVRAGLTKSSPIMGPRSRDTEVDDLQFSTPFLE